MLWYSSGSTLTIQQDKMPIGLSIRHTNSSYHSDTPSEYRSCYRPLNYLDTTYSSRSPSTSTFRSNSLSDGPLSSSSSRDRSETRESSAYSYMSNRQSRDLSKSRSTSKSSDSVLKSSPNLGTSTRKTYSGTAPTYTTSFYDELRHYSPSSYITGSTRSSYKLESRPPRYSTLARAQPTSISSSPYDKSSLTSPSLLSSKTNQEVTDANQNNILDLSIEGSNTNSASCPKLGNFQHPCENGCETDGVQEIVTDKDDSKSLGAKDKEVADQENIINIKVSLLEEGEINGKSEERECMANESVILQEKTDPQVTATRFPANNTHHTDTTLHPQTSSHIESDPLLKYEQWNVRNTTKASSPSSKKPRKVQFQETKGLVGLRNIGNTCFLNSVVQCLSNTRLLMEYITNQQYLSDINADSKGALIKAFGELIQNIWQSTNTTALNTGSFKSQIQRYAPRFDGYLQHDAQEFLRYLLEGLHEDINRVVTKPKMVLPDISDELSDSQKAQESWKRYLRTDNSKIVDIFVGQLKSTLQCTTCKHCSTTFEAFWDLSLSLPKTSGKMFLSQCLDLFTSEEILDGDEMPTCSQCKCRRKCKKRFLIHKFPQVLVLHLKRFSPGERYRKISVAVDFPVNGLDMSPYAAQSHTKAEYNLYALANHNGTASSGHYTAYCKHPHTGQWNQYNDGWVTPQSANDLVSASAYVLFYEQISSTRL